MKKKLLLNSFNKVTRKRFFLNKYIYILGILLTSVFGVENASATVYYWNGSGTISTASSWTTLRAGGGTAAANFITSGDVFIVQGTGATTNGTGTGASNQSGSATSSMTLTSTTFEVEGGASFTISSKLAAGNLIIDGNSSSYGTLTNGTSGYYAISGATTCNGVMNLVNTSNTNTFATLTVTNPSNSSITTSLSVTAKPITVSSTFTVNSGTIVSFTGASGCTVTGATTCNGTINAYNTSNTVAFSSTLLGSGVINSGSSSAASAAFTVATIPGSTFLTTGGGTVNYKYVKSNFTLLSSYNNLTIDDYNQGKTYASAPTTVYGNFTLPDYTSTANSVLLATNALTVNGNLTIGNATLNTGGVTVIAKGNVVNNGTEAGSAGKISIAAGSGTQSVSGTGSFLNIEITSGSTAVLASNINQASGTFSVLSGGTLDVGTYAISGAAAFTNASGGTLKTSKTGGLPSSITTTTKTFTTGANYVFNAATTTPFGTYTMNTPANITFTGATTLDKAITMSGVLTLGGILTTTPTNLLTLGTASTISGASSSVYVSGPLNWNLPSATATKYTFPVGTSSAYLPCDLTFTTSAAGSAAQVQPVMNTNNTTHDNTLGGVNTTEYWALTTTGSVFTSLACSLGKSSLGYASLIGVSSASSGSYTSIAGSTGATVGGITGIGVSNAITATPGTAGTFYLALAEATADVPAISTGTAGSITVSTATISTNSLTSIGAANVTSSGVAWSTTSGAESAITGSNYTTDGGAFSAAGTFTSPLSSLTANTTYYVKAYATSAASTSYGSEVSFATLPAAPTASAATLATTTGFTANWAAATEGTAYTPTYTLQYGTDNTFGTYTELTGITSTSQAISSLSAGTPYHYRVKAVTTAGSSDWSSTIDVTTVAASTDATLSALSTSAGTLSPSFASGTTTYSVVLPSGTTTIPTVSATVNESHASKVIADATTLPGSATVTVTAQDNSTTDVYTINYTVAASTDATLSALSTSAGTLSPAFDAGTITYSVELPAGTTTVPSVIATTNESHAQVEIVYATDVNGTTTVTVTAEDGSTKKVYSISYTVATGVNQVNAVTKVHASNASIMVEGYLGAKVSVVNLVGSTLYSGVISSTKETLPVSLKTGVYAVNVNGVATKVFVK
ncbi:MAG: fibronectin type III domain-containing protein [Paludibacteraceae bacterium]|nr:fibronectin type III domain-containing protein [Paludibacteraceae bacterium]